MRHGRNSCSGVLIDWQYISPSIRPNSYCRFVQEDRLAGSSLVVVEFHDHDHDHDQPDQFHFSWSDQTREPRRNRLGLQFTMGRTNPRVDAAAVLGEANPSQSQSEAATRRCHIRTGPTVPLGQRTGPSATACRVGGLRRVEVRQGGAGQGRCANSEEGTERPQLAEQAGSP